jgi:hypothetical protein
MKDLENLLKWQKINCEKSRERAIEGYYKNPNICQNCGQVIPIGEGRKVREIRRKKFCDHSCASEFTNRDRIKYPRVEHCLSCGIDLPRVRNSSGRYSRRTYCDDCRKIIKVENQGKMVRSQLEKKENGQYKQEIRLKGDLKSKTQCWVQWRTVITKHARDTYRSTKNSAKCEVCDYDHHVVVCHIKSVASFPDTATIAEINHPDNLVGLCPNCHWDLDHGLLKL